MVAFLFLPLALAFIMFSLGLSLRADDFRAVAGQWRGLAVGLAGQVLLLPLLAVLIAATLGLSREMTLGLMILAASPGGVSSAFLTHLARGNTAMSLLMTVISSLLVLITLPLIVNGVLAWHPAAGNELLPTLSSADLAVGKLLGGVLLVTTLPIVLGMFIRLRCGLVGERGERIIGRLATGFFVAIVVVTFISHRTTIVEGFPVVGGATVLLNLLSMLGGAALARLAGLGQRERVAVTLECGLQNAGLGIFVALSLFQQPLLAVPSVVYALTMNFGALAYLGLVRRVSPARGISAA